MGGVIGMQVTDTLMLHPLYSFARMPRMAQGHTFTTWPRTPPDVLLLRKISECAVLLWEELYHWEQTLHVGVPYHNPLAVSSNMFVLCPNIYIYIDTSSMHFVNVGNISHVIHIIHTYIYIYIYLYLPKGLNFSLTSNISLRRKLKTQAESDFIHILRYSDKILVDDPGEKKCSVGDVRFFLNSGL